MSDPQSWAVLVVALSGAFVSIWTAIQGRSTVKKIDTVVTVVAETAKVADQAIIVAEGVAEDQGEKLDHITYLTNSSLTAIKEELIATQAKVAILEERLESKRT